MDDNNWLISQIKSYCVKIASQKMQSAGTTLLNHMLKASNKKLKVSVNK
jgi:hypothetical protein